MGAPKMIMIWDAPDFIGIPLQAGGVPAMHHVGLCLTTCVKLRNWAEELGWNLW